MSKQLFASLEVFHFSSSHCITNEEMRKFLGTLSLIFTLLGCVSSQPSGTENSPESHANFALGVAAYNSENFPVAFNYFSKAEELQPSNASYKMHTGLALMSLERHKDAETKLKEACSMISDYAECWNNLSAFYLETNKPKESLKYSTLATQSKTYKTPGTALANQARAYIALKQYKTAIKSLEKAERISQGGCSVQILKAQASARLKYYDIALTAAKRAESLCPSEPRSHFWIAYLNYKNGDQELALNKYRSMLETFRDEKTTFQTRQYIEQLENSIPLKEPKP